MWKRGAVLAAAVACALPPAADARPIDVQLLALNDLHGHLEPAPYLAPAGVQAGGVEYLATHVRRLHAAARGETLVVSAGDLVGGSPLLSALFHDEPTIEAMDLLGLDVNAIGNHELDGARGAGAPRTRWVSSGRRLPRRGRLRGRAVRDARGEHAPRGRPRSGCFAPYAIRSVGGARIAFVGLTLEGTPDVVAPGGTAGLEFRDEADTVNALVPELRRRGVEAVVVLLHEGGAQRGRRSTRARGSPAPSSTSSRAPRARSISS